MQSDTIPDEPSLCVIFSGGGGYCLAPSRTAALLKAHDLSARATTLADSPMSIWCASTDERLDAYAIVAEWDARGWPRPTPANRPGERVA
jgi:hypothetical protein